jgi:hypothetical protein
VGGGGEDGSVGGGGEEGKGSCNRFEQGVTFASLLRFRVRRVSICDFSFKSNGRFIGHNGSTASFIQLGRRLEWPLEEIFLPVSSPSESVKSIWSGVCSSSILSSPSKARVDSASFGVATIGGVVCGFLPVCLW